MLLPTPDKIWPLDAFDCPENHKSRGDGDLGVIALMLNTYMAGHPYKPSASDAVEWVKNPHKLERHQKAALREFVDSWQFFDLWTFHFRTGCTIYEIARAMRLVGAMAPMPVHYINSMAKGYCGSGQEPDDRERLISSVRWGSDPRTIWHGFLHT